MTIQSPAARRRSCVPAPLRAVLERLPQMAVALSGGLDSRFLCHAARLCGCEVLAVHAAGPHIPRRESSGAVAWARAHGLPLLTVAYNPLALDEVAHSSRARCYACKRGLVALLRRRLADAGRVAVLCDGTNADDLEGCRPGLRALKEAGVRSPLAEAGLGKPALRAAARSTGLDRPDQRARPCLLTRYAYGLAPDVSALRRLDEAEAALEALAAQGGADGLGDFRLRLRPKPLLQVERLPERLRPAAEAILARTGFSPCEILEAPGVSGFYDRPLGGGPA